LKHSLSGLKKLWHEAFTAIQIPPSRPAFLYFEEHLYTHTHTWLRRDCIWITVATK